MKELSIEQKAKAYDEAIKNLKILHNDWAATQNRAAKEVEEIFPELAESKDEKIRYYVTKVVHEWWNRCNDPSPDFPGEEEMLAWLEKQGEHYNFRQKIQVGDQVTRNEDGILINLSQLKRVAKPAENQSEQKPIDNQVDYMSELTPFERAFHSIATKYTQNLQREEYRQAWYTKERAAEMLHAIKQKSVEWSEEDEKMFQSVYGTIEYAYGNVSKVTQWLKSLRPQKQWKPSEEKLIKGLDKAANEWDAKAMFNPFHMVMDGNRPTGVKQDIISHADSFKAGVKWIMDKIKAL